MATAVPVQTWTRVQERHEHNSLYKLYTSTPYLTLIITWGISYGLYNFTIHTYAVLIMYIGVCILHNNYSLDFNH